MAHPRCVIPGETYLLTRRCAQRSFRLRPCAETNRIFMYCLALAMEKTGVLVHAACVMSNHHHLVVTDPRGVLPDFMRELHRLIAKAMNAAQGQRENLWAAEPCNAVRLVTDDDVEDRIAYVVTNPVAAGLVKQPGDWPGFATWGDREFIVRRPAAYFREHGTCPETLVLGITEPVPRKIPSRHPGERRERVHRAIADCVADAHSQMMRERRQFVGRKAVLATSFKRRAHSQEKRQDFVPTFAAWLTEVRRRLRDAEKRFRAQHRAALELWWAGIRDVVFPWGTWAMRVFHAAPVAPPIAA